MYNEDMQTAKTCYIREMGCCIREEVGCQWILKVSWKQFLFAVNWDQMILSRKQTTRDCYKKAQCDRGDNSQIYSAKTLIKHFFFRLLGPKAPLWCLTDCISLWAILELHFLFFLLHKVVPTFVLPELLRHHTMEMLHHLGILRKMRNQPQIYSDKW